MSSKKYACVNCGHPYEAYPPDDTHSQSETYECTTCKYSDKKFWRDVIYECENCNFRNVLYWHFPQEHSFIDQRVARINRQQRLGGKT